MKALAFIIIGPLALFAYCWRNGTALGWYRGCGRAHGNPFSSQETSQ